MRIIKMMINLMMMMNIEMTSEIEIEPEIKTRVTHVFDRTLFKRNTGHSVR